MFSRRATARFLNHEWTPMDANEMRSSHPLPWASIRVHSRFPFLAVLPRCRHQPRDARANSPLAANQRDGQPCDHMRFIETVFQKLKRHPKRIVFTEGTEPRVPGRAPRAFVKLQLGALVVLGGKDEVEKVALAENDQPRPYRRRRSRGLLRRNCPPLSRGWRSSSGTAISGPNRPRRSSPTPIISAQ